MEKSWPSFSVIVCAYTQERWGLLLRCVESVREQQPSPEQIIVCIDHNPELAEVGRREWAATPVTVVENRYPGRLGSARNTALECADGDIVVFLDDDAEAPAGWLEQIARVYASAPEVQAVGGAPSPRFESPRPSWFPYEFDWVFGCVYRGLPTSHSAYGRLIGACMSVRRDAVFAVGGFHSDDHDDMDLSQRLIHRYGASSVVFDPAIQVQHFVPTHRLSWQYFWRRCYEVNRGKVLAFRDMEEAGNQSADFAFVSRFLLRSLPGYLLDLNRGGLRRSSAGLAGIALAALGNLVGRVEMARGRTRASLTRGIERSSDRGSVTSS